MTRLLPLLLLAFTLPSPAFAVAPLRESKPAGPRTMPYTGLLPAKPAPELCVYRYRITTSSPECQAFVDQALGQFYSYVWMESARCFETAIQHDPNCAIAYWGLARALAQWQRGDHTKALLKAWELRDNVSPREQMLIKAMMQEKGQLPGVGDGDQRKIKATATIDEMISLYDDDEEAWYYRAQLAGGERLFGGKASSVPFYKALVRINQLHPGANHELVHFYDRERPALGWVYAENYIQSSPGIPHAWHMQAHLAMRLGRWQKTTDRSARAIELHREYQKRAGVTPQQDSQYSHHLETLLTALVHDGRFSEARAIKKECEKCGFRLTMPFFRLHLAERDFDAALKIAEQVRAGGVSKGGKGKAPLRKGDKVQGSYLSAVAYLRKGEPERARAELEVLQAAARDRKNDKGLQLNIWEVQGLYLCQTGSGPAGLKMLQKAVDKTKNDFGKHAWGHGAYFMEAWGVGAIQCGDLKVAEEAFLEALAHDPGSVRGALGMQVVCERQGREDEAAKFAALARRCWPKAESRIFLAELAALRVDKTKPVDATRPTQE